MGFLNAIGALFFTSGDAESNGDGHNGNGEQREPKSRGTVLAIDDDPSLLNALRASLSMAGFNVLTSTSGPKGLDMLRYAQGGVRVVLLDYNMPNFDGCVTLDYIRKLSPASRVIGLTGADINMIAGRFATGVDKLITKPFRNQDLLDSIDGFVVSFEEPTVTPVDPKRR